MTNTAKSPEEQAIERFIAERGVTRLPPGGQAHFSDRDLRIEGWSRRRSDASIGSTKVSRPPRRRFT